jgi:glycosyltransferase involved in cell wall biosynthesis
MKLGYFVPEFPSQTHAFFWREAEAMEEAGATIRFLSSRRPAPDACPHAFANAARARTHYVFPPRYGAALSQLARAPRRAVAALRYVTGLVETPWRRRVYLLGLLLCAADLLDICRREGIRHVHVHSCADAAHTAALACILGDLSYSLTLHGDLPVYGVDHKAKMRRAALLTAVTQPLAEQIRAATGHEAQVIWMGVDVAAFRPPAAARRLDQPVHVVSVARLNRAKGHRFFLSAMARAVSAGLDIRYSIVGDGPYAETLAAEVAAHDLGDRVTFLGALGQDRVRALLEQADILALTSTGQGEAAPVAVMEAMACGLPVICSRIGGTPDMITHDVDGLLCEQEDVDAIFDALCRLIREDGLAARLSAAARQRAEQAFDHRVNAARLLEAIRAATSAA